VIADLLEGQYTNPVRVIAFNTSKGSSHDVSNVVALELRTRCEHHGRELPVSLQQFVERYESAKA